MPTAAFTTLGCKVNQYETQKILESFEEAGFDVVPFDSPADVYVVNSCSVTSIAESKSRYTIRRANRANPAGKVVVTGCAAQMSIRRGESIDGACVVVPNPDKLRTLDHLLAAYPGMGGELVALSKDANRPAQKFQGRTRATLKIQDGCSVMCSYCSIPYTRPGMVSRPASEVLAEAERLVELGFREIILTGVLIGAYGPETGSGGPGFEGLVEQLAGVRGLERLRISSIEMRDVTPKLIEMIQSGLVVPHLHIPLQAGDDRVLADMNRPYRQRDYIDLCERLYLSVPDMSITTDIMVGFPTEGPEEFQSTVEVCRKVGYLKVHAFRFSPRFGTPADAWGDPVDPAEKQRRSQVLAEVSGETAQAHRERFVGRTMRVLVERKSSQDGTLEGLTDSYLEVKFVGPSDLVRNTCWVRLDELRGPSFYGEVSTAPTSLSPKRASLRVVSCETGR